MNVSAYNELCDVEKASRILADGEGVGALHSLMNLIVMHKLQHVVGVRLLHRHNALFDNELMLEFEEPGSLVTFAIDRSKVACDAFPNCWMFREDGAILPLEYSTDTIVNEVGSNLIINEDFKRSFFEIIQRSGMMSILGPCVLPRSFYAQRTPDAVLVETTEETRRANVLRFVKDGYYSSDRLLPTTWSVRLSEGGGFIACERQNCVTHTACVTNGEGDHTEESDHSYQHVPFPNEGNGLDD